LRGNLGDAASHLSSAHDLNLLDSQNLLLSRLNLGVPPRVSGSYEQSATLRERGSANSEGCYQEGVHPVSAALVLAISTEGSVPCLGRPPVQ